MQSASSDPNDLNESRRQPRTSAFDNSIFTLCANDSQPGNYGTLWDPTRSFEGFHSTQAMREVANAGSTMHQAPCATPASWEEQEKQLR